MIIEENLWRRGFRIFKNSFTADTSQQPMHMMTRYHFGSMFATAAAFYNLYLIRQRIIKNSIYLTRSNNPKAIKMMCLFVGSMYFYGLFVLWHIPSLFSQIAVRTYWSSEDATTSVLIRSSLQQIILDNSKLRKVLREDGLKL